MKEFGWMCKGVGPQKPPQIDKTKVCDKAHFNPLSFIAETLLPRAALPEIVSKLLFRNLCTMLEMHVEGSCLLGNVHLWTTLAGGVYMQLTFHTS